MSQHGTMKTISCPKYGPPEVLTFAEVPIPSPRPDEVRIRIHAAGVTMSDVFIRSARLPLRVQIPFRLMMGITKPRAPIVGFVFSGVIDLVGERITRFKAGDEVYCTTGFSLGAYAEYRCMPEIDSKTYGALALKPKNLTHEEATAAAYGGSLALQYSDKGKISRATRLSSTAPRAPRAPSRSNTPSTSERTSPAYAVPTTLSSSERSVPTKSSTTRSPTDRHRAQSTILCSTRSAAAEGLLSERPLEKP
jgi:hypothetical protein